MVSTMVSSPFSSQEATSSEFGLKSCFNRAAARSVLSRYFGSFV